VDKSEIPSEINEDYSDNFDESNDASSKLTSSIKSLPKAKKQELKPIKGGRCISNETQEAADEEDEEEISVRGRNDSFNKDIKRQANADSKSESIIDETPNDSGEQSHDEYVTRIPTGKSDGMMGLIGESAS
jgi:hypothetical protein